MSWRIAQNPSAAFGLCSGDVGASAIGDECLNAPLRVRAKILVTVDDDNGAGHALYLCAECAPMAARRIADAMKAATDMKGADLDFEEARSIVFG